MPSDPDFNANTAQANLMASLPSGARVTFTEALERLTKLPSIEAAIGVVTSELSQCDAISYACNPNLDVMLVGRSHYQREEEFGRALADPAMRTWSHVNLFEKHGIPYGHALHLPIIFGHIRSLTRGTSLKVIDSDRGRLIANAYLTIDLNRGDVSPELGIAVAKALMPYFVDNTMLVCDPGKFKHVHIGGRLANIVGEL